MMNIKRYKITLTIVAIFVGLVIFNVYQNKVAFSFHTISPSKSDLELDYDSKFQVDFEYDDDNSNKNKNDDCDNNNKFSDASGHDWSRRMEQKTEYLKHRRKCILKFCGEVCDTNYDPEQDHIENEEIDDEINKTLGKLEAGNYANLRLKSKNIDCPLLFQSKVHDLSAPSFMKKPFQYIPGLLKADYTYENRVKLRSWYISENFPKNRKENYHSYRDDKWTKEEIDTKILLVQKQDWIALEGAYFVEEQEIIYNMINKFKEKVIEKHVLVVGSESPWVEAIVLAVGAKFVTTLEYNKIVTTHPQIETVLPGELSNRFTSNGQKTLFDVIVSYSSIEHSGLTRYGDAPHPWGDLVTMAKNWCYLHDNGMAFIGIPTNREDSIYFNAHRVYGPLMLSHLFSNFRLKLASWPYKLQPKNQFLQITFALEKIKLVESNS